VSLRVSGGRRLQSPPGNLARPTAARVRLAVINRLAARLRSCRWLDLCCGSGAMACEALQHGAAVVVGVEQVRRVAAVAEANLNLVATGCQPRPSVRVVTAEVIRWLTLPRPTGGGEDSAFDVIYVDPPYASGLYEAIGKAVLQGGWLRPGGVMVWECSRETSPGAPTGWGVTACRNYGGTSVLFLEPLAPTAGSNGEADSAAQGTATAVLVPGGDEQAHQGDGDQAENDAAEEGFDHGSGLGRDAPCNSSMMEARPRAFPAQP
jgi:16S rRNA (guanine(966)-N(2))-methyltransferase RsmD